jgi:arginyl-tRNA synthetase
MGTLSINGLQALLGGVGAESPIPSFPSADIQNSPIDIYVSYLAKIIVQLTECEPQVAYDSILWPDDLSDLVVVVPRLRLKDVNPHELAVELNRKVGCHGSISLAPCTCNSNTHDGKLVSKYPSFWPSVP